MTDLPDFVDTRMVKETTVEVPRVEPACIDRDTACKALKFAHPGSFLTLPDGQQLDFQYGANPNEARNGVLDVELFEAMIERYEGFFSASVPLDEPTKHPLTSGEVTHAQYQPMGGIADPHTVEVVGLLKRVVDVLNRRQLSRGRRNVRFENKS